MEPILDVMKEPIFPAITIEIKVGANSNTTDSRVANPMMYFGINGLRKFRAV